MDAKQPLPLKVPADVMRWVKKQAGVRRMPVGNYVLELLRRGIVDEAIEDTVQRAGAVMTSSLPPRQLYQQLLVLRFQQELLMSAGERAMVVGEAQRLALQEMDKIWPAGT